MTTSRKLWLGFGTLTALLLLICAAIFVRLQAIDANISRLSEVSRLRNVAAMELEINAVAYALAVRSYAESGDALLGREVESHAQKFEHQLAEYQRLVATERHRALAAQLEAMWHEYSALGQAVLDSPDRWLSPRDSQRLADLRTQLAQFLAGEVRADTAERYQSRSAAALAQTRTAERLVLLLLVGGGTVAVLTGIIVGRGILKNERALRQSEARFRTMADGAPVLIWMSGPEKGGIFFNRPWLEFTGRTMEEELGQGWLKGVHADDWPALQACEEAFQSRQPFKTQFRLRRHDGQYRWVLDTGVPRFAADGQFAGFIGSCLDITERIEADQERKETEQALRESERRATGIVQSIADGLITVDRQWRITSVNPAAERMVRPMHGGAPLIGRDLWEAFPALAGTALEENYRRAMEQRELVSLEAYYPPLDGWFDVRAYPSPEGVSIYFLDVSERKRAEEAMRRSEERYRTLFNSIDQGFCIAEMILDEGGTPVDYRIIEANPAFAEFTTLHDWGRGTVLEMMPDLERWWVDVYGRIALTGQPERFENYAAPMGKWFEVYAFRFGDPGRRQVAIFFKDITQRKLAAEALRQSEEKFRVLFEQAAVGIGRVNFADARWIDVNEAFCRMLGYSRQEMTRTPWPEITHPEDVEADLVPFRRMAAGELDNYSVEKRFIHKQGHHVWARLTLSLVRDVAGKPDYEVAIIEDITERKRAEEALRQSESFHRQTLESIPGMVFTNSRDGACDYVSTPWVEFTGVPAEQNFGDGWLQLLHPEDRERAFSAWRSAVDGREGFDVDYRLRRHDGEYAWFKVRGRAIRGTSGQIVRWFGTAVNVHDLKTAQEALQESEQRFRMMADGLALLVWVHGPDGAQQFVNQTFCEYFGVTREEMRGGRWRLLTHPDDGDGYAQEFFACLSQRRPFHAEVRVRRADGQWRWLESWARPRFSTTGEFVGMVGASADVTARREAQEALRESESRFRIIAETTPDIIYTNLPDGANNYINARFYEYTGMLPGSGEGDGWMAALHPEDRDGAVERWRRSIQSGEPLETEFRLRAANGCYRWFAVRSRPLRDAHGRILQWVGCCSDIEDAKTAQEILAGINERLNAAVVAKTAELEQSYRALRTSERMASLGTFAAGMGHDLANLLLPVRTRLEELLLDGSLSDTAKLDIRAVGGSMAHIQSLCRGLRLFAMDPESETEGSTVLHEWAADLERVLQTSMPREVMFQSRVPAGLPAVGVAPHRLSQAALNLVQNARDAIMADGGARNGSAGRIELGAEPADTPRCPGGVRLWVRDDGPGMSEEVRAHCIEPFFTTKTRGLGGTGLGLAIVHGIVSKAGGRIEIDSAPGRGTTVSLLLPPAATAGIPGAKPRAVVTLSDSRARAFAVSMLVAKGYSVETQAPAEGAAAAEAADVWITDGAAAAGSDGARVEPKPLEGKGRPVVIAVSADEAWRTLGASMVPPGAPLSELRRAVDTLTGAASGQEPLQLD